MRVKVLYFPAKPGAIVTFNNSALVVTLVAYRISCTESDDITKHDGRRTKRSQLRLEIPVSVGGGPGARVCPTSSECWQYSTYAGSSSRSADRFASSLLFAEVELASACQGTSHEVAEEERGIVDRKEPVFEQGTRAIFHHLVVATRSYLLHVPGYEFPHSTNLWRLQTSGRATTGHPVQSYWYSS